MTFLGDDSDAHFFAHGHDVLVADLAERFRIFFERQVRRVPLLEQVGQRVRWLATNDIQSGVELA